MISRDDAPETPEWRCEPHPCPFDSCAVCGPEVLTIPPNIFLSNN